MENLPFAHRAVDADEAFYLAGQQGSWSKSVSRSSATVGVEATKLLLTGGAAKALDVASKADSGVTAVQGVKALAKGDEAGALQLAQGLAGTGIGQQRISKQIGAKAGSKATGAKPSLPKPPVILSPADQANDQLIREIARRTGRWAARKGLSGTPAARGTAQHVRARNVLERYQDMFGNRGLLGESSWFDGNRVSYGSAGSVRLDAINFRTKTTWDYKFGASGIRPSQEAKIRKHANRVASIIEVRP